MHKCEIDQQVFDTEKQLHNYISHRKKVKLDAYYQKYFPRRDLLTGDLINFKNKEFYMSSLFNSRENLVAYLKKNSDRDVIKEVIKLRKEAKSLRFAPSTVETRTSPLPTPLLVKRSGFDYNTICEELGMEVRYNYDEVLKNGSGQLEILADTREQKPLVFKHANVTREKLDFGDYTSTSHYTNLYVERKSLPDLCGTLSEGFERFQKEISRAADMDSYLVVCVEENLTHLKLVGKTFNTKKIKLSTDFLGVRIRALCQQFDNVQFLFVDGRIKQAEIVEKLFLLENDVKSLDLQYFYDSKLL